MSSFTPGPWTADSENGVEAWTNGLVAIAILEPDSKFWGADYRFPEHAEMVANGRLMAASPTMYDYICRQAEKGDADAAAIIAAIG